MKKWLIILILLIASIVLLGFIFQDEIKKQFLKPTESRFESETPSTEPQFAAENLVTPWSITFLPGGDMLITEREGKLQRIGENGSRLAIEGVKQTSEGGLLGVALAPDFEESSHIYMYYTTERGGSLTNQVDRYTFSGTAVSDRTEIITNIPAASNHNGGAIAFGPDDKLYITTGDAAQPNLAQDTASLAGKLLRINADGSFPNDNPFGNATWSYGHRNPQGIAWDDKDQLWSVEHGPSGSQTGRDELNRIVRGGNYGWPVVSGDETRDGMIAPTVHSGVNETWAPAGLAYHDGTLYFAGLRGQSLYKVSIANENDVTLTRLFVSEYGRLRAVTAHNKQIYFSTSNRDGRGDPKPGDDKIIRFTP